MHMTKIYSNLSQAEREINQLCEQGWKIKDVKVEATSAATSYRVWFVYVLEKVE